MRALTVSALLLTLMFGLLASPAAAQVVTVTPSTMSFQMPSGSLQTQVFTINVTPAGPFTVSVPTYFQQFVSVSPTLGTTTPAQISVTVNSTGLAPQANAYSMLVVVQAGLAQQQIPVNISVTGAASQIAASTSSATFNFQLGGTAPVAQSLTISTLIGTAVNYNVTASSLGWLEVIPATGNTATNNIISIRANPGSLAIGAYDGTVTVTPAGVASPVALSIPVHLNVTGAPQLTLDKTALSFVWQTGTGLPASQAIRATATNTDLQLFFVVESQTDNGGSWLVVTSTGSGTPADIQVSINSAVLATLIAGNYTGRIRVTAPSISTTPQVVPVTLTVSATPLLNATPATLQFAMAAGGSLPAGQKVTVGSTSSPLAFTASFGSATGNWLTLSPVTGTSPLDVQVNVNSLSQTLPPGTYPGTITVQSGANQQTVAVSLKISDTAVLTAAPGALTFVYQTTKVPPSDQFFTVSSSGGAIKFSAAATVQSGGNWLSLTVTPDFVLTTPASIGVRVNTAGLNPGTYQGTVTLTPQVANATAVTVQVTFQVSASPLLRIGPSELSFIFQPGGSMSSTASLAVESTGDPVTFAVSTAINTGANWLGIYGPTVGATPTNVSVSVNAAGLAPGLYTGSVTLTPLNGTPAQTIPVKVSVAAGTLVVSPASVVFNQVLGGTAPAAQNLNLSNGASGGGTLPFSITVQSDAPGGWLNVTPTAGTAPSAVSVAVSTVGLPVGVYNGTITIQAIGAANSPQRIGVTLNVTAPPPLNTISVNPASLSFSGTAVSVPPAQNISVQGSTTGMTMTATVTTQQGGNWISVTPASGPLPATISVSIVPAVLAGLAPATYAGSVRIDSPNTSNSPQTVNVTLTVSPVLPAVAGIVNAASYLPGAVAPGEILYIAGSSMGPTTLAVPIPNPAFPTLFQDVRVLFDGIPAPLIYVSDQKISAIVPWVIGGRASTSVQVEYKAQRSPAITMQVGALAPGIFSATASGTGQGAVLNQDNSYNGTAAGTKRTAKSSPSQSAIIQVFGTGGGATAPAGIDGQIAPGIVAPVVALPWTASVGGVPARVTYAGAAPSLVSGVLQMNVEIPAEAPSGPAVPVVILIGGVPTQAGITVAIE